MKKLLLIPLLSLFVTMSCEKEPVINSTSLIIPSPQTPPQASPPINPMNTAPNVFAGVS